MLSRNTASKIEKNAGTSVLYLMGVYSEEETINIDK